jgi:hypothetical protein
MRARFARHGLSPVGHTVATHHRMQRIKIFHGCDRRMLLSRRLFPVSQKMTGHAAGVTRSLTPEEGERSPVRR